QPRSSTRSGWWLVSHGRTRPSSRSNSSRLREGSTAMGLCLRKRSRRSVMRGGKTPGGGQGTDDSIYQTAPGPRKLRRNIRRPDARERFAARGSETDALRRLAEAKRAPLAPELLAELTAYHRRLEASPASLAALERMGRGEAVCAVAGQQPAPLGGPLYSLHKV